MTRREVIRAGGLGALGLTAGGMLLPRAGHAALVRDPLQPTPDGWYPNVNNPVIDRTSNSQFGGFEHRYYVTMLPVGLFGASVVASWYMWVWTHNHQANSCRLFKATNPLGPWSLHTTFTPPQGNSTVPLTCGPVAWDGSRNLFVAAPHGQNGGHQVPYLMTSPDGWNWTMKTGTPAFYAGSWGDNHVGYSRFLTDIRGRLAYVNGTARLFFVGYNEDTNNNARMGGASSSDLINWSKRTTPLCNPRNGGVFKMGSVLYYDGQTKATMGFHETAGNAAVFYLKNQTFKSDPFSNWQDADPGIPFYRDLQGVIADAPYYVISNNKDQHFIAFASAGIDSATDPSWRVNVGFRNPDIV